MRVRNALLSQIVTDFYDKLKSLTSGALMMRPVLAVGLKLLCECLCVGYASFDYEPAAQREADVVMVRRVRARVCVYVL